MSDDLLERAIDGDLSSAEEDTLAGRLKAEPEFARRWMRLSRDEALIAEGVAEMRPGRSDAGSPPARSPGWGWAAAAAALLVLLFAAWPRTAAGPVLVAATGSVDLRHDRITTGPASTAELRLVDGTRLALAAETVVALSREGRSTFLQVLSGRARAGGVDVVEGRLAIVEPGRPISVVGVTPPSSASAPDFGSGRGLRAEYFDDETLANRRLTRIDPQVDFMWGLGSPHPSIEPETFSVRWRGEVEAVHSEPVTFHVVSDDGARLWVDGRAIVDDWTVRGTRERTGTIDFVAGRRYDLRLEYLQAVSISRVSLLWSSMSQPRATVPAVRLYPAPSANHLIDEAFSEGRLTPGVWNARLGRAFFEPGYLVFPEGPVAEAPVLASARTYERKPGLCLAAVYLGNVHRGDGEADNPAVQFSTEPRPADRARAGPGWSMGQRQGRSLNTAAPFGGYPIRNDNLDTMFLVVLRESGAYYLACGEPDAPPPRARLVRVTSTGAERSLHAAISGGRANARFASITLTDLGGRWAEPYGLAAAHEAAPAPGLRDVVLSEGHWEAVVTGAGAVVFAAKDDENQLRFEIDPRGTRLVRRKAGRDEVLDAFTWREAKADGVPHRLAVRLEGRTVDLYVDDRRATYGTELPPVEPMGTRAGAESAKEFVAWPASVDLPEELASKIPPVYREADGDVIVHDDFEAPDGTPLEGRMPKAGRKPWKVGAGEWTIRGGAAMLSKEPGWARLDAGLENFEVAATIALPKSAPPWPKDWFAAIQSRCPGTGPIEPFGGINARFLWQGGSNEIEVWDRPGESPDMRARWAEPSGPNAGRILTKLINATNITPMLKPGETHRLRVVVRGSRVSYLCDDVLVGSGNTRVARGTWAGLNVDAQGDAGVRFLDFTVRTFRARR